MIFSFGLHLGWLLGCNGGGRRGRIAVQRTVLVSPGLSSQGVYPCPFGMGESFGGQSKRSGDVHRLIRAEAPFGWDVCRGLWDAISGLLKGALPAPCMSADKGVGEGVGV